ncbi:major facilitator superfamily transporter [Aspergillus saccharolyticus JOP 1030-1]|uniref:Major facilitator superfamily transporter n=1 Tax=Aspergillus saccharolyticus JOP 1030-1 TaxID=1450539 RepID=A0A319A182_9EURO|nr:major facilitator superfamily transporter [Aspergillus saccharolyticus JOP 1030-1]PYH41262.1 major facilitator superfamily transporter [Aspergillus saccharolyticus JOP 1030-1]
MHILWYVTRRVVLSRTDRKTGSLHGAGTNSRIFEIQTAAIRYELGDHHTYDFIEGHLPAPLQPGIELIATKDEPVYAYFDEQDPDSGVVAYKHLEELLHHEGPYDGVIAFSQTGTMILTYLAHLTKSGPNCQLPFKFAIILSITHPPLDYEAFQRGIIAPIDLESETYKDVIPIPTGHIWGSLDQAANKVALTNTICRAEVRWVHIALSLFLATAEITIISTSLITITRHLDGADQSTWIITSYLLAFAGFLTVWAKCSDFIGLKLAILVSLAIFTAFSGGCAAAQTMSQLIICRAFQGMGGSGVFSSCLSSLIRMLPPERFDLASAVGSGVLTFALILGSLIGGGISTSGDWRWIFLCNVPAGVVAWISIYFLVPRDFDSTSSPASAVRLRPWSFATKADTVGCLLLLAFSVLFVAAFQEANVRYAWSSATTVSILTISGLLLVGFIAWEWLVANRKCWGFEPILPWGILRNRVLLGAILGCFLTGPAVTILYIELPQRFQTVNQSSALRAGLQVLTFGVGSPAGAAICSLLAGRFGCPFVYLAAAGSVLQIVGAFLLASVPATLRIWPGQYGYMAITGVGTGISIAALYMCVPVVVRGSTDQATAMGLTLQARMIGASLGVAIVNSILIDYVEGHLPGTISDVHVLSGLPAGVQEEVRRVYAEGYGRQMYAVGAFGAAQWIAVMLMWKREQVRFVQ